MFGIKLIFYDLSRILQLSEFVWTLRSKNLQENIKKRNQNKIIFNTQKVKTWQKENRQQGFEFLGHNT